MSEPVNIARLTVDLRFEGTYYHPSEMVDVATGWIEGGLTDRDDLCDVEISGTVNPGKDATEDDDFYVNGDSGYKTLYHEPCDGFVAFIDAGDTLPKLAKAAREHKCEVKPS